jgi:hypothetical protein
VLDDNCRLDSLCFEQATLADITAGAAAAATAPATDVLPAKPLRSGDANKGLTRPPNAYALFVKDQYSAMLRRLPDGSHDMASVSRCVPAHVHLPRGQAARTADMHCLSRRIKDVHGSALSAWPNAVQDGRMLPGFGRDVLHRPHHSVLTGLAGR